MGNFLSESYLLQVLNQSLFMRKVFCAILFLFIINGCGLRVSDAVEESLCRVENCVEECQDNALLLLQNIPHSFFPNSGIGFIMVILLLGGLGFYQYMKRKHKEELLKHGEKILIKDTVYTFRKERLQTGIRSFSSSPWKEKLEEVQKAITSGEYIKPADQDLLYQTLDTHFKEFIADLTTIYPGMSKENIYYCILSGLKYRKRILVYCMRTPAGTLRTRKSRLKKNMTEETFQLIFNS